MFTLGIILARAGSKGLPDKCVRPLLGRPLIEYTFGHARGSRKLDAIVLTTDSVPAQRLAARAGIDVIERPAELASDTATIDAAARHAVETWEQQHDRKVDAVALLYANIPVRAAGVIDRCIEQLATGGGSSIRTVARIGKHHPDWLHRLDGDRMSQYRANSIYRRQDLEPLYFHDGAVVVVRRTALFDALQTPTDAQAFLGDDRRALIQPVEDAVDVDDSVDLATAEALLRGSRDPLMNRHASPAKVMVIAEAGVNHDGSLDKALRLVDAAVAAGADGVKFQIFRADDLACASAAPAEYQRRAGATSQREMLRQLELSDAAFSRVRNHCRDAGIEFLATPFGLRDVDRLLTLDVRRIKIASTDIDNTPLLRRIVETGRPLILSCGAATALEIDHAVESIRAWGGGERLTLLHCISCYPTPIHATNLRAIARMRDTYGLPVGFSDHTRGIRTGAWAVAAGAMMLEKHFTLDCGEPGPDHAMSLEPDQLRDYVDAVRDVEAALGDGAPGFRDVEVDVRRTARKSIVAAAEIAIGTVLTPELLAAKRPGGGISPGEWDKLLGKRTTTTIAADAPIRWSDVTDVPHAPITIAPAPGGDILVDPTPDSSPSDAEAPVLVGHAGA